MLVDCHAHFEYNNGNMMMFAHHADKMLNRLDKVDCDYVIQATNRPLDSRPSIQAHAEYDVFAKKLYQESGGKGLSYFIYDPRVADIDLGVIDKFHDDPAFCAIKIHPSGHGVWASDESYRPCWEAARKYDLPIMAHTWALTSNPKQKFSTPEQFVKFLEEYPDVNFVYGHSGGRTPGIKEAAEIGSTHKNAYFDMAGDVYNRHFVEFMVSKVGADHLMGGSDMPWFDLSMVIGMVLGANITTEEKELILGGTAAKLFGLA